MGQEAGGSRLPAYRSNVFIGLARGETPMADVVWTVRASKSDLEALLKEIRQFEGQQGSQRLIPSDCTPAPVPRDIDSPLGQMEWYEIVVAPILGAAGNALYEGIRALIRKFVATKPNQASFTEKPEA
jgi:hypothetical protein